MDGGPTPKPLHALTKQFRCLECGKVQKKKRPWQKFCKSKCRNNFHNRNRILMEVPNEINN